MALLTTEGTECEGSWASLPVLLIWMIKDKLDIFDNWRFEAVCRDWRCASQCYPKILQSVGDGLPWILQSSVDPESRVWELICVTRERKLTLDMPELATARVLFSKEGWLFLLTGWCHRKDYANESLLLVNLFTRDKIILPGILQDHDIPLGYFTTKDGSPHRIFLLFSGGGQLTIGETCPGDQAWTNHVFFEGTTSPGDFFSFVVIGDNGYCIDCDFGNMAFNMGNNSWKCLPKTMEFLGYFIDLDGHLVFIELSGPELHSFAFYRYDDGNSSWKMLSNYEVMDTSWFLSSDNYCIVAKGKGLKVYRRTRTITYETFGRSRRRMMTSCVTHVDVHNLVRGSRETLRLPFELCGSSHWVDIG